MLTLTLDGQPVDLPADAAVALSYRSSDLRRLDTREAAFSETFALPLTAQNARVLGTPHALSSQTRSPYRRLPAVLRANGVPVLRGVAVLEASEAGYEITLLDDTADLFGRVGDSGLRELDLSALDHPYDMASVQAASASGPALGYAYALADDGRLTARDPAVGLLWHELTQVVPCRTVLDAIVARALPGYALAGSLLSDATFAAAVFPRATATPRLRESARAPYAVRALRPAPVREHDAGSGKYYPLVPFPRQLTGDAAHFDGTSFTTPPYPADIRVSARLLVRVDAEFATAAVANAVAAVRVVDAADAAGVAVYEQVLAEGSGIFFAVAVSQQAPGLRVLEFDFTLSAHPASRQLAVQMRLENGAGLTIGADSTIGFTVGERTNAGAPVHLDASLPDISQGDALKLFCNQYNVLIHVESAARTVRFDLFNELERRRGEAVDWSAKFDHGPRPRLEYRLSGYAQRNTFAYQPAPAAYDALLLAAPPELATGMAALPVPDETLAVTAEAFAAAVLLPLAHPALNGAADLLWLPFVSDPTPTVAPTRYNAGTAYKGPARVFYGGRLWRLLLVGDLETVAGTPPRLTPVPVKLFFAQTMQVAWAVEEYTSANDELPTVATLLASAPLGLLVYDDAPASTSFAVTLALSRAGLSFAELLPAYHEGIARILSRVQLLAGSFLLNATDIAALDFGRPVYLNVRWLPGYGELRGYFYLNLIDQYRPGNPGPVRCELIRLGDPVAALAAAVAPLPERPARLLLTEAGQPLASENTQYLTEEL